MTFSRAHSSQLVTGQALNQPFQARWKTRWKARFSPIRQFGGLLIGSAALTLSVLSSPAFAGDPFRPSNPNPTVDSYTETAFEQIFEAGNYTAAEATLATAVQNGSNDPLIYAMQASIAYLDQDWSQLTTAAQTTESKAQALMSQDPLRGNLYQAVGIFLQGAAMLKEQGIARGTPQALAMLQQVFSHVEAAEKIAPNDPELSLLKGFMDLMLAVNLPFSNPQQAIDRLENNAYPAYLAHRGIALGYRDLENYDSALASINQAIAEVATDNLTNPELLALKAQILGLKGDRSGSETTYEAALVYQDQLHPRLASQVRFEHCLIEGQLEGPVCFEQSGLSAYER